MIKYIKGYEHLYQINDNGIVFRNNKQFNVSFQLIYKIWSSL